MAFRQPSDALQVTMQPLQPPNPAGPSGAGSAAAEGGPPVPLRWQQAVTNLESAAENMDKLAQALDGALYLDDGEWQKALPVHKYNIAVQVQHQRISELERQLGELAARLAESERGRTAAEGLVKELNGELENNARVFQLHYEELMRKEKEIADLQAVVSTLSLGDGGAGGSGSGSFGGGGAGPRSGGGGDILFGGLGEAPPAPAAAAAATAAVRSSRELDAALGALGGLSEAELERLEGLGLGGGSIGEECDEDEEVESMIEQISEEVRLTQLL